MEFISRGIIRLLMKYKINLLLFDSRIISKKNIGLTE